MSAPVVIRGQWPRALAIRLSTMWLAILLGILCLLTFIRSGAVVSAGASPAS